MKMQSLSPMTIAARAKYTVFADNAFVSAWAVLTEVAGRYRGHRALALECQRDLLRFAALNNGRILPGLAGDRAPFIYFERQAVDAWLDEGGRSWIIAELEIRNDRRVVAFPPKGGDA